MLVFTSIEGVLGPYLCDKWAYVTDRVGFLAVPKNIKPAPRPSPAGWAEISRPLLALPANKRQLDLNALREFINKRCDEIEDGPAECLVLNCCMDAKQLKKWLAAIPFDSCTAARCSTATVQTPKGHCLVMEGKGWKLVVAGLIQILRNPPRFPQKDKRVTG